MSFNNYCINCGKLGHNNKLCSEPIISCGIICFNISKISLFKIENFLYNKFIEIEDYNYKNKNYIKKINKYKKDIKFLLIQRKHSLSYIEFLRGRYDEKNQINIEKLFSLMSINEIKNIKDTEFQILWDNLWLKTARNKNYLKEMNVSKKKFNYIKNNNLLNNISSQYITPEWGFPKGRRNKYEKNIDCSKREFIEETNFTNFTLLDRINKVEETFVGSNNIDYKHIYYIAGAETTDLELLNDNYEIGNIGWFTIDEVINILRPYDITKINLINQINFFLTIVMEKVNDEKTRLKQIINI
jgi:ADP-ribose pyrophosphatase YjhB (NUDIX family)